MIINKNFVYFSIVAFGISSLILMGLGPALIGGMATYLLITSLYVKLSTLKNNSFTEKFKVNFSVFISVIFMLLFAGLVAKSLYSLVVHNRLELMLSYMIDLLEQIKTFINTKITSGFLSNINNENDLKQAIIDFLKHNSKMLLGMGNTIFHFLLIILLGMIIGSIYSYSYLYKKYILKVNDIQEHSDYSILVSYISSFSEKFKIILYSQFWVAIVNTIASFLYLAVVLPLFNIDVPYKTVAIVITFIASLIPIIGNLISNTVITALSLAAGVKVAIASLIYLVVIHKFEYIVIAKVVGEKIKSSIWEILCAIIIFEILFGLAGMVLAPVIYVYIKEELKKLNFFGK